MDAWAGKRIHHVDQRSVGLRVGEDLRDAAAEGVGEIEVIVDSRVAAGRARHVLVGATDFRNRNAYATPDKHR